MSKTGRSREKIQGTPKAVHPRAVRLHGLFGVTFLRQHMMMDHRWTVDSLTDEFKNMSDLFARRLVFQRMEFNANRKRYNYENSLLRRHCRDGRAKLHMSLHGNTSNNIRNTLINHKDMQRLYQKMPVGMVVDNINQRTFVLRKERDRLRFRLNQLKKIYRNKLLERSLVENRLRYESLNIIDEETKAREFYKKIENSNVRLRAIKTINVTFEKIIQVLRHDAIFYEPILKSLNLDIADQANFIKHVLHVGMPAIAKFKVLNEEYRKMEEKSRKNLQIKLQHVAKYRSKEAVQRRASISKRLTAEHTTGIKRYVRETNSMLSLKNILENIENIIKTVKFATLCSQAKEIFPRMKSQVDNNIRLKKMIENDMLGHHTLEAKLQRAEVLEGVLINNLSDDEMMRLDRIKSLKKAIDFEQQFEKDCLKYMKNRCDAYVLLRCGLWNISELLRHVGRSQKAPRINYPNSYLKLPLLKFEMFTMRACPPEIYEENIDTIMHGVKRKVNLLMKAYKTEVTAEQMTKNNNEYHTIFMDCLDLDDLSETNQKQDDDDDLAIEGKILQNVPNRKQIKSESAKIVEEYSKRDD